jgi:murein DD-endopeptidase MepM/ murein hydrolase activator NlpD/GH24 family phage-related lysozyme (muramidase)
MAVNWRPPLTKQQRWRQHVARNSGYYAGQGVNKAATRVRYKAERQVQQQSADLLNEVLVFSVKMALHLVTIGGATSLALFIIFAHYLNALTDMGGNMGMAQRLLKLAGISVPGFLFQGAGQDFSDLGPKVSQGDVFQRFDGGSVAVNSGWGMRVHPKSGKRKHHSGIDLPLEGGYPQRVWTETQVTCIPSANSGGYGNMATLKTQNGTYRSAHLQDETCVQGTLNAGQIFGLTGTTGVSTGNHVHWEQLNGLGRPEHPNRNPLQAMLTGQWPGGAAGADSAAGLDLEFIKSKEGYQQCAYPDGTQWSKGHGVKAAHAGDCYAPGAEGKAQAHEDMVAYIDKNILPIMPEGLSACQATAVTSFVYNTGPGAQSWDIWKDFTPEGSPQFTRYTKASTGVSLLKRRQAEQAKWNEC